MAAFFCSVNDVFVNKNASMVQKSVHLLMPFVKITRSFEELLNLYVLEHYENLGNIRKQSAGDSKTNRNLLF